MVDRIWNKAPFDEYYMDPTLLACFDCRHIKLLPSSNVADNGFTFYALVCFLDETEPEIVDPLATSEKMSNNMIAIISACSAHSARLEGMEHAKAFRHSPSGCAREAS